MPSRSQPTSGQYSDANPKPPPPILIFELNQVRRAKVTRELESLRSAFLERPTLEALEAFVEKKTEYNEMMGDHIEDLHAVTRELLLIVEARKRAANIAEERRLQEFQRVLERMDPAEAEAARRTERERPFHLQRRIAARAVALEDEWIRERDRVRATFERPHTITLELEASSISNERGKAVKAPLSRSRCHVQVAVES